MDIIKFKKDLDRYSNADILSIAKMYGFMAPMQDLRWLVAINHANKKQMPDAMALINKHFPGAKITSLPNGDISVVYKCHDKHELDIEFTIRKDVVYIHFLTKCNEQSGTEMLTRIIDIARGLNKNVSLSDVSELYYGDDPNVDACIFSLTNLYILLYGQSWYNKFGFKSQDYDAELAHNKKVRSMKLSDYLDLLLQKRREHVIAMKTRVYNPLPDGLSAGFRVRREEIQRKRLNAIDKKYGGKENFIKHINKELDVELGKFRELALSIAKNSNMTVAEFAKQLYDSYISGKLNDCKNENVQFIVKFFDWSGKILKYNAKLTLTLN